MRISIAADHNGVALKRHLVDWLIAGGHTVDDRGTHSSEKVDYPPVCADVCQQVLDGNAERAIMVGGSGQGEHIACNKIVGVRAGLCETLFATQISRAHNDSNVLVLGAKVITPQLAEDITAAWLTVEFAGGDHRRRLEQIAAMELRPGTTSGPPA